MGRRYYLYFVFSCSLALGLSQAGCVSVPNSPSPRLYMPHSIAKNQAVEEFAFPEGVFIAVGPIRVPEYLDRPQMITRDEDGLLNIAQFDRWAELIDSAILRMMAENLIVMLPRANIVKFPWSFENPVKYQVGLDIIQMDSNLKKNLTLIVRWNIFDENNRQTLFSKRSEVIEPIVPHNYFGLNEAFSAAIASLSSEIAEQLSIEAKHPETKN